VKSGYKNTDAGIIPEDWVCAKLSEFFSFISYGFTNPMPTVQDGIFMITAADINHGRLQLETARHTSKTAYQTLLTAKSKPKSNDILLTKDGTLGRLALVGDETICINQSVAVIRPNERIDPQFLKLLLESPRYQKRMMDDAGGSTIKHIYITIVDKMPIGVTLSKDEQRAIAKALSDVDALLSSLDQLITKKRNLKQAAMQQLLTGKTRLPGFSGDWEVERLGEFVNFYKGKGLPKSELSETGVEPCIHYGELFTRYSSTIDDIFSRTDRSKDVFRSVSNDVLMPASDVTPRGLAKASCVNVDGVILGGDILVIRSDKNRIYGPFLSLVIRYEETQILQLVTGSTVYHLYGSDMKNFTFAVPSRSEQVAIANVLADFDIELAVLERRRDKIRALKQAMMQELLTGKTRLV